MNNIKPEALQDIEDLKEIITDHIIDHPPTNRFKEPKVTFFSINPDESIKIMEDVITIMTNVDNIIITEGKTFIVEVCINREPINNTVILNATIDNDNIQLDNTELIYNKDNFNIIKPLVVRAIEEPNTITKYSRITITANDPNIDDIIIPITIMDNDKEPIIALELMEILTSEINLAIEETTTAPIINYTPNNATNKKVKWESDHIGVHVDEDTGEITGLYSRSTGTTITAISDENNTITASYKVFVK